MIQLLRSDETAEAGNQQLNGILWDAVFATCNGRPARLMAYVEGAELAQFIADKE